MMSNLWMSVSGVAKMKLFAATFAAATFAEWKDPTLIIASMTVALAI